MCNAHVTTARVPSSAGSRGGAAKAMYGAWERGEGGGGAGACAAAPRERQGARRACRGSAEKRLSGQIRMGLVSVQMMQLRAGGCVASSAPDGEDAHAGGAREQAADHAPAQARLDDQVLAAELLSNQLVHGDVPVGGGVLCVECVCMGEGEVSARQGEAKLLSNELVHGDVPVHICAGSGVSEGEE